MSAPPPLLRSPPQPQFHSPPSRLLTWPQPYWCCCRPLHRCCALLRTCDSTSLLRQGISRHHLLLFHYEMSIEGSSSSVAAPPPINLSATNEYLSTENNALIKFWMDGDDP